MQLSRNGKGAIAFLSVIAIAHIWTMLSAAYKPPWEPWQPLVPLMSNYIVPFLHHVYRPVLIGFSGLAIFWIWDGRKEGFALAAILSAIAAGFGVLITFFNGLSGELSGTFTALVAVAYPGVMAFWYSVKGLREVGAVD
jgi:hypothetical protein